jgi:hypothetical protein
MRVYLGPTDAKHWHASLTLEQLHWFAAVLRSARDDKTFAAVPDGLEMLDRLDDAIRGVPKAAREAIRKPFKR